MKFSYQSQKFNQGRSALMLPHTRGEAASIADAFGLIVHGLHDLKEKDLSDDARRLLAKLKDMMDTTGLTDATGNGLYFVKAQTFNDDQKLELSRTVDELASYFDMEMWQSAQ